MQTFYADDTYLRSSKADVMPRIHMLGGIIVHRDDEPKLIETVQEAKARYTHKNLPVKWNFKDTAIRDTYQKFDRVSEYETMVRASREWRLDIAHRISQMRFSILVACIEAYSGEKEIVKNAKGDLHTFSFENLLMRIGMDAKEQGGNWQCVLDWPPDGNPRPFDSAYYRLYHYGTDSGGSKIWSGPLSKHGFSTSLFYARCNHSPLLQISDLIIGATRDHLEANMQDRTCLGSEVVAILRSRYRQSEGKIAGFGVIASSGSQQLKKVVGTAFSELG